MKLRQRFDRDGAFLFRWRSYLPLLLLVMAIPAFIEAVRIEESLGSQVSHAWVYLCMAISYSGQLIRCLTVGFVPARTSGRGAKRQQAAVLNTTGMYSIVRNPLYLGNFIVMLGLTMSLMVWWFTLLFILMYWLYIERIICIEEEFLSSRFGAIYDEWCAKTPIFIPELSRWRPSDLPFSLKTVLKREYHGVLAIAASYFCIEAILDLGFEGQAWNNWIAEDDTWFYLLVVCTLMYFLFMFLNKRTKLLTVSGR